MEVPLAVVYNASDKTEPEHRKTEEEMREFIKPNPELLEDGLRILHHELPIDVGTIDLVGAKRDGNRVIIEVKNQYAKLSHVDQLQRYVKYYGRTDRASVRGLLVAPRFGKKLNGNSEKPGLRNIGWKSSISKI